MASKKEQTCRTFVKCDFCKAVIRQGDKMVVSRVFDQDGLYTLRHHKECDRTADLTALAQKEFS
jgi:hypothetical protein